MSLGYTDIHQMKALRTSYVPHLSLGVAESRSCWVGAPNSARLAGSLPDCLAYQPLLTSMCWNHVWAGVKEWWRGGWGRGWPWLVQQRCRKRSSVWGCGGGGRLSVSMRTESIIHQKEHGPNINWQTILILGAKTHSGPHLFMGGGSPRPLFLRHWATCILAISGGDHDWVYAVDSFLGRK